MDGVIASMAYRGLSRADRQRIFLDILTTPTFSDRTAWGACFHAWVEEQAAEGRTLGEIARRIDLPSHAGEESEQSWQLLDDHVVWMIEHAHARVVRIEIVA
jgi:hypothetical protein